jgi:hypothetical protein
MEMGKRWLEDGYLRASIGIRKEVSFPYTFLGFNEIHRYKKKSCQVEIFFFLISKKISLKKRKAPQVHRKYT